MTFVNEIVSEQDVDAYNLSDLRWKFFSNPFYEKDPPGFRHTWTIDREQNVFLLFLMNIEEDGRSGRPEPTMEHLFLLWLNESEYVVRLRLEDVSSSKLTDNPFVRVWSLVRVEKNGNLVLPENKPDLVEKLKSALSVYGFRGARRQVPNTIVQCNFSELV